MRSHVSLQHLPADRFRIVSTINILVGKPLFYKQEILQIQQHMIQNRPGFEFVPAFGKGLLFHLVKYLLQICALPVRNIFLMNIRCKILR